MIFYLDKMQPKGQLLSEVGTMLRRGAPKLDENGKPMRDARGKVIYVEGEDDEDQPHA